MVDDFWGKGAWGDKTKKAKPATKKKGPTLLERLDLV